MGSLFCHIPLPINNCISDKFPTHSYQEKLSRSVLHHLLELSTLKSLHRITMGSLFGQALSYAFFFVIAKKATSMPFKLEKHELMFDFEKEN